MDRNKLKKLLTEELTISEVKEVIKSETKDLDKRIEKEVKLQLKKEKISEKEIKEIAAKVVSNFIDVLFIRKQWYKSQLTK